MERLLREHFVGFRYATVFFWLPIRNFARDPSRATAVQFAKYVLGMVLLVLWVIVTISIALGGLTVYFMCLLFVLKALSFFCFLLVMIGGVSFIVYDFVGVTPGRAIRLAKSRMDKIVTHSCLYFIAITIIPIAIAVAAIFKACIEVCNQLISSSIERVASEQNGAVYLSSNLVPGEIRLLKIYPGNFESAIKCELLTENLLTSKYEALSYVWSSIYERRRLQVGSHKMVVGTNLYNALRHLRHPNKTRTIWADAICINQMDVDERNLQVKQMKDIYKHASSVAIWLGNSYGQHVELGMEYISKLAHAKPADIDNIWRESNKWQQSIDAIFRVEWWERAWVVQEAVLAQQAVVHWGNHTVPFEDLCGFIANPTIADRLPSLQRMAVFNFVEMMRRLRQTHSDPIYGLLSHAYMFRFRRSTDSRDKLYALIGLLSMDDNILIQIDYSKPEKEVFMDFARCWIERHKNLLVIALAEERKVSDSSWCVSWAPFSPFWVKHIDMTEFQLLSPFWSGGLDDQRWCPLQLAGKCSAAGGHPAIFNTEVGDPDIISVTGFTYDTIIAIGDHPAWQVFTSWWDLLAEWEDLAFRSSSGPKDCKRLSFNRTVTANAMDDVECDWKKWVPRSACGWSRYQPYSGKAHEPSPQDLMKAACRGRRFFVTSKGNFGLGPADSEVGDLVCVLLGSDVPFVLSRHKPVRIGTDLLGLHPSFPILHKFKGQAYVDRIMVYPGDMKEDIKNGSVRLEEYFLL